MQYLMLVLCLKLTVVLSNPMMIQLSGLHQLSPQTQEMSLQELQALQMLQAIQRINNQQPLTVGLPPAAQFYIPTRTPVITNIFEKPDVNSEAAQNTKVSEKGDFDSVIINAEEHSEDIRLQNRKVLLVLSSPLSKEGRFGIGSIISSIPFFPIEINVIDAATWIYNNIGNIIGSLRPPFGQSQAETTPMQQTNKGIILNTLIKGKEETIPMMALPVNVHMLHFQNVAQYRPLLPIQV